MAGNAVTLTFAGDATKLNKAAAQASAATESVGDAAARASQQTTDAGRSADVYSGRMARIGATAAGMSAAVGDAGGTVSALAALQSRGADRAQAQARALADVEQAGLDAEQALGDLKQAQLDLNQAQLDAKQAGVDAEQAVLDQKQAAIDAAQAQKDYNAAVKEHGKGSIEARQAAQDLAQAQLDLKQAGVDSGQAQADLAQANEDAAQAGRDMAQANRDAKDAQLNLNDAQKAADPSTLSRVGTEIELLSTAALGLVGTLNLLAMANNAVSLASIKSAAATTASKAAQLAGAAATGIATAAQWAWNVAMSANPIGIVIVAIGALVGAIIWIATQTTWFQDLWGAIWGKIGEPVKAAWDWIKKITTTAFNWYISLPGKIGRAFGKIGGLISSPFRSAFNSVSRAWNATVGRLSWTVPGWVPGVGGNSISAPRLPTFHSGGTVPGRPGENVLAVLQAGEQIKSPSASGGGGSVLVLQSSGRSVDDLLLEILRAAIKHRGGDPVAVLRS
ncbi:hypothetical protein E1211_15215 [Micromonospora sp. 15K316]|uniref:hypothetical protein n=1 Tax=unclassified Micromonospora TaxID=2617518 RepID=UPI001043BF5F|nr:MULTISPECIES: hypothetical protein [unclassified Micromonospora]TDB71805.1 hypothetical protein E1165_22010 [Micromonospora sp. KC723]TDC35656.1 hypothetical protein E1211_15215 [Micromonospora sp. 15K316]